jgi:hypothetical protein
MTTHKIIGLLVILLGIPFGLTALDGTLPPAAFIGAGMIPIFFGAERINDERVQQLKMKALFTAMSAGIALTMLANIVLTVRSTPRPAVHDLLSAYEFLAAMLLISLGLFHFWRWQDARATAG